MEGWLSMTKSHGGRNATRELNSRLFVDSHVNIWRHCITSSSDPILAHSQYATYTYYTYSLYIL